MKIAALAFWAGSVAAVSLLSAAATAGNLPVPCAAPGACATANAWVSSGKATATQVGTQLTVNQQSNQAILNWQSFNIAAGSTVKFNQPSTSAAALNRIYQNDPSQIFGNLTANGQIYLINQNGIIFGPHAQVNVNSLVASTLNITDQTFLGGILQTSLLANNTPVFTSDGRVYATDQNGNLVLDATDLPIPVAVVVQQGAQIATSAAGGGRIMLLGQQVQNGGSLSAPAGQVILAAGQTVYLQASDDPALRGLVVAVDGGGPVSNLLSGQISAPTGNVTLLGLAVNQDGRVSATTSVNENGSVKLLAESSHVISQDSLGNLVLNGSESGTLELGPQSVTSVSPEIGSSATAAETALPNPSTIQLIGHQIHLTGGSSIVAPSGQVSLQATLNPSTEGQGTSISPDPGSEIRIDPGASIDVSGSEVTLPVSSNIIAVQLRGNELRNDPQQRNGILEGQTVYIDTRADNGKGTTIADVSGEIADIPYSVGQLTTSGGTISVLSDGDAVLAQGAKLNVSGGAVTYTGGIVATTQLATPDGHVYDIGSANPNLTYAKVINPTVSTINTKWGAITSFPTFAGNAQYEPGYVEGANAGSIQFAGRSLVINGTLLGAAVAGPLQRTASTQPLGGELIIGNPVAENTDFTAPYVDFSASVSPVVVAPGTPLALDTLDLPTNYLTAGGFTRTTIYSNGEIILPVGLPLNLAANSTFSLTAPEIDLASSINAPGGSIKLSSSVPVAAVLGYPGRGGIQIGDAVTLDVSGNWVNDAPELAGGNPTSPISSNGGSVSLSMATPGGALIVGNHADIDVSAGAYASPSGALSVGNAGSIVLAAPAENSKIQIGQGLMLAGYGVDAGPGGSLTILANRIQVVHDGQAWATTQSVDFNDANAQSFNLSDSLFSQGGFATFNIGANGPQTTTMSQATLAPLVVGAGANIDSIVATRTLPADVLFHDPTGATLASFAPVEIPLSNQRLPVNLSFSVYSSVAGTVTSSNEGDLVVEAGAGISADPGSTFTFTAPTNIRMGGTLQAPAGTISLNLSPPSPVLDIGYSATQGIYLEPGSLLDVSGTTVMTPSAVGLLTGQVLAGGSVNVVADRGSIFGLAGSAIDVSGTHAILDIPTGISPPSVAAENIASAGGSVTLIAPESITLQTMLSAGSGAAPGTAGPAGGSLTIALTRNDGFVPPQPDSNVPPFPTSPRAIIVGPITSQGSSGVAVINEATITNGGFSALTLAADDVIDVMAGTSLNLTQSIALQAPNIAAFGSGTASLQAATVALGPTNMATQTPNAATAGSSVLSVQAGLIQLNGNLALQGFDQTSLSASSDLQAVGVLNGQQLTGSLSTSGTLTLAAREIYPTTLSQFTIAVANGTIDTRSTGSAEPVLSAGGSLTVSAADIDHAGTIEAPFGQVSLNATQSLQLEPGSTLSVSGNGQTIPFGETQNGTVWVYNLAPGPAETTSQILSVLSPPSKQITLAAPSVQVAKGATVDDSGGGDLFAFEFVAGLGGSTDALSAANSPNTYAILPQLHTYGPVDPEYSAGSSLQPGAAVYLSGVPGELAAGTYTLLPARYALLPGAFLVTAVSGQQDLLPGAMASAANGAPIVSGYLTTVGTSLRDSRTSGFEIEPGSYAQQLAQYDITSANTFFPAQAAANGTPAPQIPLDAGGLALSVVNNLVLDGTINTAPAAGGRGANVDLSAENLQIVSAVSAGNDNAVQVSASSLEALGAQSLLIGGTRSTAADGGTIVTVAAQDVSLAPGTKLSAPEVLLTGQSMVSVSAGAQLTATGTSSTLGGGILTLDSSTGSAALVRVSGGGQVTLANPAPSAAAGSVDIAQGAALSAMGSITVSSTHDTQSQGQINANQGSLSLAAPLISLGDGAPTGQALVISDAQLADFGKLTQLILTSQTSIDLYNGVTLGTLSTQGTASLGSLVLDAGAIRGFGSGDSTLAAGTVRLTYSGPHTAPLPGTGAGNLQIEGASLELDAGSYGFSGFQNVTLASMSDLIANGSATITAQGNLALQGTRIMGNSGADLSINAAGFAFKTQGVSPLPQLTAVTPGAGVIVAVNADTIDHGGIFDLPSGQLSLEATTGLTLDSGSVIEVAGVAQTFGSVTVATPGGSVLLKSDQGSVSMASGARVDVSGSAAGGDAGSLEIDAAGTASVAGTLVAQAQNGASGGSFTLDAGQIANFASLTSALNVAGFSQRQNITQGSGDLILPTGSQMTANSVALTANDGSVTINGDINARSALGGTVQLNASGDVLLGASGSIEVDATGPSAVGGTVEFNTSQGSIETASGSSISAGGPGGGGTVVFRAPAAGNDVAITALNGNITGAGSVLARVVQVYDGVSTVDDGMQATIESNLANFSSTAATITQRLGQSNNAVFGVEAAVELRSSGDMVVSDPWDLSGFRPNGLPGELTLRAAGNLQIDATISDGLEPTGGRLEPLTGPSWSYRLTGGADRGSANPDAVVSLAIVAAGGGDVVIGSGVAVGSGTGNIRVDAAQDVVFQDQTAVLYTSGVPVASMPALNYTYLKNSALNWTTGGGDIDIFAGRDVVGAASNQVITSWQLREVNSTLQPDTETLWGTNFGSFQENVGALGGGNVTISAARDVLNFSAVIPTTGAADHVTGTEQIWGGGNLTVTAGRDLLGGVYYVGQGAGTISAGRSITTGTGAAGAPFGTVLALGNGSFDVTAGNTLELDTVLNPTVIGQPITNQPARTYFSTYASTSSVNLVALSGDLSLLNDHGAFTDVVGSVIGNNTNTTTGTPPDDWYPGVVSAAALGGNIDILHSFLLFPSPVGKIDLLASNTVSLSTDGVNFGIDQPDVQTALLPTPVTPAKSPVAATDDLVLTQAPSSQHNNDSTPSVIIAQSGDILGGSLNFSEPAQLIAGRDIVNVNLSTENFQASDVTLLQAGRDITYANDTNSADQISVGGPGTLEMLAGRNINLGSSAGVTTLGSTVNQDLPGTTGATVIALAGLGQQPAYQGFITQYLVDETAYAPQLTQYMQSLTGNAMLSAAAALTDFQNLTSSQQLPLIATVFFNELNQAGLEATAGQKPGYVRGFDAINTLFPGSLTASGATTPAANLPYSGDLLLDFSRIYTIDGGDIDLFVPGGLLNVGLANPPVNAPFRTASQLGIVAQSTGSVDAFAYGDVLVNQSRIFTLDGGNIVIWSSTGNIDAGRGAKTAISAPPPVLVVNPDGSVTIDFAGAVVGSGIRTILTEPDVVPGNVDLIAPVGIVNASDAGIGSAGNLNIAAQTVLGATNINVGGTATGVPSPTNSLAAGLTGVSNSANNASKDAIADVSNAANTANASASPFADSALSWLDVFVTGLGEENCKPEDIACLTRQKKN